MSSSIINPSMVKIKFDCKLDIVKLIEWPFDEKPKTFDDMNHATQEQVDSCKKLLEKTIKTKKLCNDVHYTHYPAYGCWVALNRYAAPTDTGGVILTSIATTSDHLFSGNLDKIRNGKLYIKNNLTISAKELRVLHYYVSGSSAKNTAKELFITKKAVETAVSRVKDKLVFTKEPDLSLMQNLKRRNLIEMLLAKSDWIQYSKDQTPL